MNVVSGQPFDVWRVFGNWSQSETKSRRSNDFTKDSRNSTQSQARANPKSSIMARLTMWYNGEASITEARNYSPRSMENLNQGNTDTVGLWGANSRKTFISRSTYMIEHSPVPVWTMCLTYRSEPDHKESKKHINVMLQFLRRRKMFGYVYAVEYQERKKSGLEPTLHYHFILACEFVQVQKLNDHWSKVRGDYSKNAVRDVRTVKGINNAAKYAAKVSQYASKTAAARNQSKIPQDVRLWATSYNLVGKEKITVTDGNEVNYLLTKAEKVEHKRVKTVKDGRSMEFEYILLDFGRAQVQETYSLAEVQKDNARLLLERRKRIRRERKEKRRQIALNLSG